MEGMVDSGETCGNQSSVGDEFIDNIYGTDVSCAVIVVNRLSGGEGTWEAGLACGYVNEPEYLADNDCGEAIKGEEISE